MSDGELSRLEVLRDLDRKRLTTEAAAQLLGLERRQVFRLLKAYRAEGATGLISKRRGRRSGAALRLGLRVRPPPDPDHRGVTFLNGRNSDISKWWTQKFSRMPVPHRCTGA